jgi:hypothetical protein
METLLTPSCFGWTIFEVRKICYTDPKSCVAKHKYDHKNLILIINSLMLEQGSYRFMGEKLSEIPFFTLLLIFESLLLILRFFIPILICFQNKFGNAIAFCKL